MIVIVLQGKGVKTNISQEYMFCSLLVCCVSEIFINDNDMITSLNIDNYFCRLAIDYRLFLDVARQKWAQLGQNASMKFIATPPIAVYHLI